MTLHLAPCTPLAARFACKSWHYSRSLPCPPLVRFGVWESGAFVGVVTFSRGANRFLAHSFGLPQTQACELSRVALRPHETPVSRIVAVAVRLLGRQCPGLRLVVSFADPAVGHVGAIYQAMGWVYLGQTEGSYVYVDNRGRRWHPRMVSPTGLKRVYGRPRRVVRTTECERVSTPGKHRYAVALDAEIREQLQVLAQPYPKGCEIPPALREPSTESGARATSPRGRIDTTGSLQIADAHV